MGNQRTLRQRQTNNNQRGTRALNINEQEVIEMTKSTKTLRKLTLADVRETVPSLVNVPDDKLNETLDAINIELIKAGAVIDGDLVSKISTANFNVICERMLLTRHRTENIEFVRNEVTFTIENENLNINDIEKHALIERITIYIVDNNLDRRNEEQYDLAFTKHITELETAEPRVKEKERRLPVGTIKTGAAEVQVVSIDDKGEVSERMHAEIATDGNTTTISKTHELNQDGVVTTNTTVETTVKEVPPVDLKTVGDQVVTEHTEKATLKQEHEIVGGNHGSTKTTIRAMVDGKEVDATAVRITDTTIPYSVSFTQQTVTGKPTAIAAADSKWELRSPEEKRQIIKDILTGFREYNTTTLEYSHALIIPMQGVNIYSLTGDELDVAIWGQVDPFSGDAFEHHAIRDFQVGDGILYFEYAEEVA